MLEQLGQTLGHAMNFNPLALGAASDPLITAMATRPALSAGIAGHTAGMAGQAFGGPLSILDAPRRAVAGGLMSAMGQGQQQNPDGSMSTASFLPALAGLAAGGLSAAIP